MLWNHILPCCCRWFIRPVMGCKEGYKSNTTGRIVRQVLRQISRSKNLETIVCVQDNFIQQFIFRNQKFSLSSSWLGWTGSLWYLAWGKLNLESYKFSWNRRWIHWPSSWSIQLSQLYIQLVPKQACHYCLNFLIWNP